MSEKQAQFSRIFELMLLSSLRLDMLSKRFSSRLGIVEEYILAEVDRSAPISSKELAETLTLDKSTISKVVSRFMEMGLLKVKVSDVDQRVKNVEMTAQGRSAARENRDLKNQQVQEFVRLLSEQDQKELAQLVRKLSDAFDAPAIQIDPTQHPLRAELTRLTRVTGFLGDNLLGSHISYQRCEMLFLCGEQTSGISFAELDRRVPYDKTVVSRMVSELEKQGILIKEVNAHDKRSLHLRLSEEGERERKKMFNLCIHTLSGALKKLTPVSVTRLELLLKNALPNESQGELQLGVQNKKVFAVRTAVQKKLARSALIELLVRENLQNDLPDQSLSPGNRYYLLAQEGKPQAVLELQWHGKIGEVLTWVGDRKLCSSEQLFTLLEESLREVRDHYGVETFTSRWLGILNVLSKDQDGKRDDRGVELNAETLRKIKLRM